MKVKGRQFGTPQVRPRWMEHAGVLGRFASVQAAAQLVGVASGILLVRNLTPNEYAYFTIANSMQGTMNVLADSGLSIGLQAIGGKVWSDPHRFGQLIATTMRLRRRLALLAIAVITPILLWLLISNGSPKVDAGLVTATVLLGLNFQLATGVLMVVPRLLAQVRRLQTLDLAVAAIRLVLVGVAYFTLFNALTAIIAGVLTTGVQYVFARRWAAEGTVAATAEDPKDRREMVRIMRNQVPTTIFYCIQGQLIVWLMSLVGNSQSVANVGALGRLSILFSVVTSTMTTIVVPRFARYQSPPLLRRRFLQITTAFVLFGAGLVFFAAIAPHALLWILGTKYAALEHELLLMMILTAVTSVVTAMWSLNSAKAWIEYSWIHIPSTVAMQLLLLIILNVSTLRGALLFGTYSLFPTIILNIILAIRGLRAASRAFQADVQVVRT